MDSLGQNIVTPAQQREYLQALRKENSEMYHLTGSRPSNSKDPWAYPTPNPRTARAQQDSNEGIKIKGPPKPPKSTQLRSRATFGEPNMSRSDTSHMMQDMKTKPKPLPQIPTKPATLSSNVPEISSSTIDSKKPMVAPKKLPATPEKKVSTPREQSSSSRPQTMLSRPAEILPETEHIRADSSRRVTIPVFRFDDVGQAQSKQVPDETPTNHSTVRIMESFSDLSREPIRKSDELPFLDSKGIRTKRRGRRLPVPDAQKEQVRRGLCCAHCYQSFGNGRVIKANGKTYHPSHFLCYECDTPLEHVEFYAHHPSPSVDGEQPDANDTELYCHFDFHELFSQRCFVCTTPVIRGGIQALGRTYHAEHFFCALCSKTFSDSSKNAQQYVEMDGMAWHPKCYEEKFSASYMCRKCKERIPAGHQVHTIGTGTHFHSECFRCAHCKDTLQHGFYWSKNKNGICRQCMELELKEGL